jgi:Fe-S cluster assembly protein SufD
VTALRDRLLAHAAARASALPGRDFAPLARRRAQALESFRAGGLPTQRQEDWRFTPLRLLERMELEPALQRAGGPAAAPARAGLRGALSVPFADGFAEPRLPQGGLPAGLRIESLAQALARQPELVAARLGTIADDKLRTLTALNTALFEDGLFLELDADCALEQPLHLLFCQEPHAVPRSTHPRCWIALGPRSRATVIEHHLGGAGAGGFVNAVTEISLGAGAELAHVKLQQEGPNAVHLAQVAVRQEGGGRFASHSLALGAGLSRVEIHTALEGEHAEARLHGLYLGRDTQHVDHHTRIEHAAPQTTSRELYKGILDDRAHGVFHGHIRVRPDAQRIDAQQQSRTLLLADGPTINAKPQLEIYADDVRCSHGATVGRLDETALFYLRSRGLAEPEARALLTLAFAREVVQELPVPELVERLEVAILAWLVEGSRR